MKYDSKLEKNLHQANPEFEFHPKEKVQYITVHHYEPDFKYLNYYVETKGRFRTSAEATKYLSVRDNLPDGMELVFILQKEGVYMPSSKERKDGTRATMEEWLTKKNFRYFYIKDFTKEQLCKSPKI